MFLCGKREIVGEESQPKSFFWIEFVDRNLQPNYKAQRGVDAKKLPPEGISKEEVIELIAYSTGVAFRVATTVGFLVQNL